MAHVEIDERTDKVTIHYGDEEKYGPMDNNTHILFLSKWIVNLLKQVARLEELPDARLRSGNESGNGTNI